ncbi:MAG: hypothetical protein QXE51_00270 [Nitrososphaeria archaeon]
MGFIQDLVNFYSQKGSLISFEDLLKFAEESASKGVYLTVFYQDALEVVGRFSRACFERIIDLDEQEFKSLSPTQIACIRFQRDDVLETSFKDLIGVLHVYVDESENTILLKEFIPNSPRSVILSDVNKIEIFKTEDGYFLPDKFMILRNPTLEYRFLFDLEHDGAESISLRDETKGEKHDESER